MELVCRGRRGRMQLGSNFFGMRQKLSVAFVAMTLVPLFVTAIITFRETEDAMRQAVFERNRYLAMNMASEVDQLLSEKVRLLKAFARNAEVVSMQARRLEPVLRDVISQYPEMGIAFVVDDHGRMIARSDGGDTGINYADRAYFVEAMQQKRTAFSGVIISRSTGKTVIAVAEPILAYSGKITGLFVINVEVGKMLTLMKSHGAGEDSYAYIVNRGGMVLVHPHPAMMGKTGEVSELPPVRMVREGRNGWVEYSYQGQEKLAGFAVVPTPGWGLIFQQSLSSVMRESDRLKTTNAFIIVVAGGIAVVIGFFMASAMARPVNEISAAARKMAAGDLEVSLDIRRKDEIGRLAESFNDMAEQLKRRDESIRVIQEKLQRQNAYLNALHEVSLGLINCLEDDNFVEGIVKRAAELVGTEHGFLYLLEKERDCFVRKVGLGVYARDIGREIRVGDGLVTKVMETGSPVIISDYSNWQSGVSAPIFREIGAVLQIPLKSSHGFYGTIGLAFVDKTRSFGDEEVAILTQFAEMASIAYESASLFAMTQQEIASRREAEQQSRQYAAELERSNRELEQYAYVSSHDLQEPLRKIIAFGDRLRTVSSGSMDEKGRDYLERMQNAAARMRQLIEDLLTYSRISSKARLMDDVPLNGVLADVLTNLDYRIETSFARVMVDTLPMVKADRMLMVQLFQNFVSNALKFHRESVRPEVRLYSEVREDGATEIAIEDNGIGFDEKYLDRIFTPFQRLHTRNEFEGTGMGLAICLKILERHGWTINASSRPGEGSRFVVSVPADSIVLPAGMNVGGQLNLFNG